MFYLQVTAADVEAFTQTYAFIPSQFNFFDSTTYFYVFSAMFMHGGLAHIASNLWFLHIFGDNVEDRFGHIRYLIFYLLSGFAATMAQYSIAPSSEILMLGASGAISGVAGAYFVFFKNSTVRTFIFMGFANISAPLFLGYWFLLQVYSGVNSLQTMSGEEGGVAWFAHIGGFVAGYLLAKLMPTRIEPPPTFG